MNSKPLKELCLRQLERIADDIPKDTLKNEAFNLIEMYEQGVIEIEQFKDCFLEVCEENTKENKKFWADIHLTNIILNKETQHWCEQCTFAIVNCEISEYLMKKLIKLIKDFELSEEDKKELLSICKKRQQ